MVNRLANTRLTARRVTQQAIVRRDFRVVNKGYLRPSTGSRQVTGLAVIRCGVEVIGCFAAVSQASGTMATHTATENLGVIHPCAGYHPAAALVTTVALGTGSDLDMLAGRRFACGQSAVMAAGTGANDFGVIDAVRCDGPVLREMAGFAVFGRLDVIHRFSECNLSVVTTDAGANDFGVIDAVGRD